MKRILVMSFGSDAGGIEKSLIEFLKFLLKEGHKVDLYLWRKPGVLYDMIPKAVNILNFKLNPGSLRNSKTLKDFVWYLQLRIAKVLNNPVRCFRPFPKGPYDIAISYCQNGYSPYYIIDKVDATKKIMFYHHGSYDVTGYGKKLDEKHYLMYDRFVTVSDSNRLMLESHFSKMIGHIDIIYNLVDEEGIKKLADEPCEIKPSEKLKLCTVGRISPEKGQILAIETAKILTEGGLDFIWYFVGDGSDRSKCENLVKEYKLQDICIFVGMKSNPYPFIKICDFYVQPSHVEADPVTIREAKVLGKHIITTNIAAFEEALSAGKLGIICNENAKSLSNGILSAVDGNCPKSSLEERVNTQTEHQLRKLLE